MSMLHELLRTSLTPCSYGDHGGSPDPWSSLTGIGQLLALCALTLILGFVTVALISLAMGEHLPLLRMDFPPFIALSLIVCLSIVPLHQ